MKQTKVLLSGLVMGLVAGFAIAADAHASDVYTWQSGGVNYYSDAPRALIKQKVQVIDLRTREVMAADPKSPADAAPSKGLTPEEVLKKNQEIADSNRKILEENERGRQNNCRIARLNYDIAQKAGSDNRAQLLARYRADIQSYCN